MASASTYIYTPLPTLNHIRILLLHPEQDSQDKSLSASLLPCDLKQPESFEALSYVWGDPSKRIPVTIDGRELDIGQNLHDALLHLRHAKTPRRIWADAACIDQRNDTEKSHQVSIMRRIYSTAASTIMWLGKKDSVSEQDMETFKGLTTNLSRHITHRHRHPHSDLPALRMISPLIENALDIMKKHTYFGRSWITQEVATSQRLLFTCGSTQFDFGHMLLVAALLEIDQNTSIGWNSLLLLRNAVRSHISEDRCRCHDNNPNLDGDEGWETVDDDDESTFSEPDLLCLDCRLPFLVPGVSKRNRMEQLPELLIQERDKKATDPRDKIYALLGISQQPDDWHLNPDYSLGVNELYILVAKLFIQQDLSILCCSQPHHSSRGLPSWVPDWSQPSRGGLHSRKTPSCSPYKAGNHLRRNVDVGTQGDTIRIRGVRLDVVQSTKGVPFNDWKPNRWFPKSVVHTFTDQVLDMGYQGQYPFTGEPYNIVLLQVLTAGRGYDIMCHDTTTFQHLSVRGDFEINPFNPHNMRWSLLYTRLVWKDGEWDVFETEKGYIGLGPTSTQPGDVVVLAGGAPVPFILRPSGQGFKFVGECFVHGVMFGEVDDIGATEDFQIY